MKRALTYVVLLCVCFQNPQAQQERGVARATVPDGAQEFDPDLVPRDEPRFRPHVPHAHPGGAGVVFTVDGPDTFDTPGMFAVSNGSTQFLRELRWILVGPGFWDLDGDANFENSLEPVIDTTVGMSPEDVSWSGVPEGDTHPATIIATIDPPMAPGAFFSFGADTDFYKSDPCPGGNFGTSPPAIATVSIVPGMDGASCSFSMLSPLASEALCTPGSMVMLDFETEDDFQTTLANGQAIAPPEEFGVIVDVNGFGLDTYGAAIFDSTPGGPNAGGPDQDLLVDLGNVLILQESPDQSVPGFYDEPDDAQLGGTLAFDFVNPIQLLALDLIDICPGPPSQDVQLTLLDTSLRTRTFFVPDGWTSDVTVSGTGFGTLDLTTLMAQPGELSVATAVEDPTFDPFEVIRLIVAFSSSGALDNLVLDLDPQAALCVEFDPGVEEEFFIGGPGTGRAVYFTANETFTIDSAGIRFGLIEQSFDVVIYQGQGVTADVGPVLASASGIRGGLGLQWYDLAIDFTFEAGQDYVLNWRPTDSNNEWVEIPTPYFSWGNSSQDDVDLGLVTIRDGREGFDADSFLNTVAPRMRVGLGGACPTPVGTPPTSVPLSYVGGAAATAGE